MSEIATLLPGITGITPRQDKGSAWESPNLYLVGDDSLTLIDSGYDRADHVGLVLEAVGSKTLVRIVITHGHIDHAGGAWAIREATGAEVCAHPLERAGIERRFPGQTPDRSIEEGETLKAGEFELEMLLLPGHTPGHLCPYDRKRGILFSSDLVTGEGSTLVAPPEGNMKQYMDSLYSLRKLGRLERLLPGHGPVPAEPRKRIEQLIEHRELREVNIALCLKKGPLPLKELVREMYAGLIHPQMEGAAAWTAWAHLQKLMEEGKVTADPEGETNPFNMTFRLAPGLELPF